MVTKSASIHVRLSPVLKARVENILGKLGLSTSEAISIYFNQIDMKSGLPFEVKIPNKATKKAISQVRKDIGKKSFSTTQDLMKNLNA
jgi:DNA-damage-inducible protein J